MASDDEIQPPLDRNQLWVLAGSLCVVAGLIAIFLGVANRNDTKPAGTAQPTGLNVAYTPSDAVAFSPGPATAHLKLTNGGVAVAAGATRPFEVLTSTSPAEGISATVADPGNGLALVAEAVNTNDLWLFRPTPKYGGWVLQHFVKGKSVKTAPLTLTTSAKGTGAALYRSGDQLIAQVGVDKKVSVTVTSAGPTKVGVATLGADRGGFAAIRQW